MNYQLVLQFSGETEEDFNYLIDVEDELEEKLVGDLEVDGHDFGSGQMNIFIMTSDPVSVFDQAKSILSDIYKELPCMKAAYRDINTSNFIVLWPKNLKEFVVS